MSNRKVAVVTGANKGLGFAIVKGLCENLEGTVYLTSRDENRGKTACEELKRIGLNPQFHQLDVTDKQSVENFYEHLKNQHGFIDILINNAGILFLKDAAEPKVYQAEQTIFVNFYSLVDFCETILPLVREGGRIINISSSSGHLSRIPSETLRQKLKSPDLTLKELKNMMNDYLNSVKEDREIEDGWGDSPYVVSKVGVNAYTFMLHRTLIDKGVIVNCVHPGYVQSDMTRGGGDISPAQGAVTPLQLALGPTGAIGERYVWHNGQDVSWDGPDPRGFIDGKKL